MSASVSLCLCRFQNSHWCCQLSQSNDLWGYPRERQRDRETETSLIVSQDYGFQNHHVKTAVPYIPHTHNYYYYCVGVSLVLSASILYTEREKRRRKDYNRMKNRPARISSNPYDTNDPLTEWWHLPHPCSLHPGKNTHRDSSHVLSLIEAIS